MKKDDKLLDYAIKLRNMNYSYQKIADELKVCNATIYNWLNPTNVQKYRKNTIKWKKINKDRIRLVNGNYIKNKYKNDINFRLSNILRSRLSVVFRKKIKNGSAVKDLGCSIQDFKLRIEMLWLPNMTWENYGEWHIDHIIPLSFFNLKDRTQLVQAVNFTNLQPLWAEDNLKKNKYRSF